MHRIDRDVQVHAVRINAGADENRYRLEVCAGLSAACAAEGISEGAALRLDGIELAHSDKTTSIDHSPPFENTPVAVLDRRTR